MAKLSGALKKAAKHYRTLREDGGLSAPTALVCLVRSAYYRRFNKEEYGDMMCFRYIKFNHPDIYETMFTQKDNAELLPLVNDEAELPLLREKHRLLQLLDGAGRRYLYVPECSEEELSRFLEEGGKGRYVLKPDDNAGSRGISFLDTNGKEHEVESAKRERRKIGIHELYQELKSGNILIEEYIQQHEELDRLFPGCVNTVFIHTVRLPDGHAEVAGLLYFECGCGDSCYVNSGDDIVIGVHDDGTLFPFGFSRKHGYRNPVKVIQHPDSGITFDGFQIPYWSEAIQLALDAAEKVPQLTYIKWDIAITNDGPVIIEGNGMPGGYRNGQTYSLEARHVGTKEERSEFLRALAFSKTLTPAKIKEINRTVIGQWDACDPDGCDTVVVLGSARSTSRVKAALNAFGHEQSIRYVLCGGNASIHPEDPQDPDGAKLTEAEYMKGILLQHGVREQQIFIDNTSRNTAENLLHAAACLKRIGAKRVAFVSAWFHGRRLKQLLEKDDYLGLSPQCICFIPAYGDDTRPDNWFRSVYGIKAIYHEWKEL